MRALRLFKRKSWLILMILAIEFVSLGGQARAYLSCDSNSNPRPNRNSLSEPNNFNPQAEGQPIKGSCPAGVVGQQKCSYYKVTSLIRHYEVAEENPCVKLGTTENPLYKPYHRRCCRARSESCVLARVDIDPFYKRLINRPMNINNKTQNTCCVEGCPTSNYWAEMKNRFPSSLAKKTIFTQSSTTPGGSITNGSSFPSDMTSYGLNGAGSLCTSFPTTTALTQPADNDCVETVNGVTRPVQVTYDLPQEDGSTVSITEDIKACGMDMCPQTPVPSGTSNTGGSAVAPPTVNGEF